MNERVGTLKSYVEGPRWADFPKFLKDACFMHDLEIVYMDIDKGWFRETTRFKVEGSEPNLIRLQKVIADAVKEYNASRFWKP